MKTVDSASNRNDDAILELSSGNTGDFVTELTEILEKEIACYGDLLAAAREEQKAIIHGKLKELKLTVEAEENLIASSRALDEVRERFVAVIAGNFGLDAKGATLKQLISRVDPAHQGALNRLRDDLLKITNDLQFVNRANAQLIKSSIEFINQTMWILLQSGRKPDNIYDSQGKGQKPVMHRALVDRLT